MSKFCFIISTIGDENTPERIESNKKLNHVFRPVLEELGYEHKRADEEFTPGSISSQIVKRIIDSEILIADISTENPNVFYELAIRHAVNKPVIIVKQPKQVPPFDVYDTRAISVDMSDPDIWQPAKEQLKEYILEAERNPTKASESILTGFSFDINTRQVENIESEVLRNVKDIQGELKRMNLKINSMTNRELLDVLKNPYPTIGTLEYGTKIAGIGPWKVKCKKCGFQIVARDQVSILTAQTGTGKRKFEEECSKCGTKHMYIARNYSNGIKSWG